MNPNIPVDNTPDQAFLQDLFTLRQYYALFQRFMGTFATSATLADADANERYLEMCIKIEGILENPKFNTLTMYHWRPCENILSVDLSIEWENGQRQMCGDFQSKIDEMYIRSGKKEFKLESADQKTLNEIINFLHAHEKTEQRVRETLSEFWGKKMKSSQSTSPKSSEENVHSEETVKEKIYSPDKEYDLYKELKKIFKEATRRVLIVDPYIDTTIYEMFIEGIPHNAKIRLLTTKPSVAVVQLGKKLRKKRPLEIVDSTLIHDRCIFVDDKCWMLGSSLKDAARSKPTMLIQISTACNEVFRIYDALWKKGKDVLSANT